MVADQATNLMMSFVGLQGDPKDCDLDAADVTLVIVARGGAKRRIMDWIASASEGTPMVEVERPPT